MPAAPASGKMRVLERRMNRNRPTIGLFAALTLVLCGAGWFAAAGPGQETVSSRAYRGHENDADMKGFIARYPAASGSRLDDCQMLHMAHRALQR